MLDIVANHSIERLASIVTRIAEQHHIPGEITLTDHLVDSGMTSIAMVDLMLAVEAEFDVMIPQREMTPANFQSIKSLACMLRRMSGDA